MEARLNANLNPDGFAMHGPDPKYHDGKWSRGDAMVWVDDDSLIFGGFINAGEPDDAPTPMYMWKISTNEVKLIVEDGFGICKFGQDFYSYSVRRNGKRYWREGKLGDMKERDFDVKTSYDKYRCRVYPDDESPFRQPVFELEYGGKIKRTKALSGPDARVEFQAIGSDEFVTLPFSWREIRGGYPQFLQFPGAYIFQGDSSRQGSLSASRAWLVWLDGRNEMVQMPRGPWSETFPRYLPAKVGWLVQLSNRGLYLVQGDGVKKLAKGDPKGTVISPNGCRAAAIFHRPGGNLWVVDFCSLRGNGK